MVQHYVEEERRRYRRVLFWTSATLLFAIVGVAVVFSAVSVVMLRRTRWASDTLHELQRRTEASSAELASVAHSARLAEKSTEEVRSAFRAVESERLRESRQLKSELERFARWVTTRTAGAADETFPGEGRLRELEAQIQQTAHGLEELKKRYEAALASTPGKPDKSAGSGSTLAAASGEATGTGDVNPGATPGRIVPDSIRELLGGSNIVSASRQVSQGEILVLTFPNGDRYEGTVKDGLLHGWGIYYYRNGDRYEGEFKNDLKEGTGTFFFRNGDYYQGQFKDDQINGKGRMFYHDGNRYAGDFRNGLRHGNGTLWFHNGDIYQGEFRDDVRTGRGTYVFADGGKYIGEFLDGKRHGQGRYIYPSGEEYVGSFKNGLKDGLGDSIYPDGRRIRGLWKDDRLVKWLEEE